MSNHTLIPTIEIPSLADGFNQAFAMHLTYVDQGNRPCIPMLSLTCGTMERAV
ncbi:MAG: hypothetical protein AAGA36_05790 [Pseudomonadota bacterium]